MYPKKSRRAGRFAVILFRILVVPFGMCVADAQNAGLCLHASSPATPPDKVEAFEFSKHEKLEEGYRFFLPSSSAYVVTNYRLRAIVLYPRNIIPATPQTQAALESLEKNFALYPASRASLSPWINKIKQIEAEHRKQIAQSESLPRLQLGSRTYVGATFGGFEKCSVILKHQEGVAKIPVADLPADFLPKLISVDPSAKWIRSITIDGRILYNPKFDAIAEGEISLKHEGGTFRLPLEKVGKDLVLINGLIPAGSRLNPASFDGKTFYNLRIAAFEPDFLRLAHAGGGGTLRYDEINTKKIEDLNRLPDVSPKLLVVSLGGRNYLNPSFDGLDGNVVKIRHRGGREAIPFFRLSNSELTTINSWSDGSWKVAEPGVRGYEDGTYSELILANAKKYSSVQIRRLEGESVVLTSNEGEFELTINQVSGLRGLSSDDQERIDKMVAEILKARSAATRISESRTILGFVQSDDEDFTDVIAIIGQVVHDPSGVLVDGFRGRRCSGANEVQVTKLKSYTHPLTGETIRDVVSTHMVTEKEFASEREDRQCFLACKPGDLVDGDLIRLGAVRRKGSFSYTTVIGAARTVPRYE